MLALEDMLTQAADPTSTVSTPEVWWELYQWQNKCGSVADPNRVPYLLRPELWPKMHIRTVLAISDGSSPNFHTSDRIPDNKPFYKAENTVDTSCNIDHCEDGSGEGVEAPVSTDRTPSEQVGHENLKTLWHAACVVEGGEPINTLIAKEFRNLQVDTDCDSDTDVEARVSPEARRNIHFAVVVILLRMRKCLLVFHKLLQRTCHIYLNDV